MKRLSLVFGMMLMVLAGRAAGSVNLRGTVYSVDTLFHAYIAPGTTQTSLLLRSGTTKVLRVFYSTVDLSDPNVVIRAVSGTDRMTGSETVRNMATRKSGPGHRYFMGVNGDFWYTSGVTSRGVSMVGTPISSSMAEGVIYRAQNNDGEYQYMIDKNGMPGLGNVVFGGTITNSGGASAPIAGVNKDAPGGAITIYNPTYYSGTNQGGNCAEVTVRYADGDDSFAFNQPVKLIVVGNPSNAGDMDVPTTGLVLHAHGSTYDFINNLKDGDELTMNLTATLGGVSVDPSEIISGQPWIVRNGETYADGNPDVHPRTALGYTEGGKAAIFMVVDGRSPLSNGITTDALGDLMRYAGCYMAVNVDGGGSSTLYTSALGIRNRPSDGTERADSNGIFAVSTYPDDDEVTDVRFLDWALQIPKYGTYTPKFFGYNRYGMLVNTDVKGVKLSVDEKIGVVKNDTTLYATGSGTDSLYADFNGKRIAISVTVLVSSDGVNLRTDSIINDTFRDYAVELQGTVLDKTMAIDPAALSWISGDESIVKIDAETGVLRGVADGSTIVVGSIDDISDTLKVIVEKPTAHVMPIDPYLDPTTWKFSHSGGKNGVATANGQGFDYTYTGASSRAPKLTLSKEVRLWSLPDTLRLRVDPGEAPVKNFIFGMRSRGSNLNYQTITPDSIPANKEIVIDLPTSRWMDADDMAMYPITLNSIQINMNAAETGKEYTMHFLGFETVYNAVEPAVNVRGDVDRNGTVNVSDVTELVNMILGITPLNGTVADVDANGTINVSDVTELVNIILGIAK